VLVASFRTRLLNVLIFVGDDFDQFTFFNNRDSLLLEPFLGFFLKIEVVESVWIYDWHVFCNLWVTLLVDVTLLSWNS
jgi:hypothetical protein